MNHNILSAKQYRMARLIKQEGEFSRSKAQEFLQPTFASMVKRGYLVTNDGETFVRTPLLIESLAKFEQADVTRTNTGRPLSEFLERYISRQSRSRKVRRITSAA